MANYLYNGVQLPVLPEWDKTAYPYAYIYKSYLDPKYSLVAFNARPYNYADGTTGVYGVSSRVLWFLQDGGWSGFTEYIDSTDVTLANEVIWTNTDILNEDGSVYLAASEPIPVNPIDPNSLLQGYLVGCRLRSMRGKKTITGYSYNGTVLPALPEWDKTTYPYAFIKASKSLEEYFEANGTYDGCAYLYCTTQPVTTNGSEEYIGYYTTGGNANMNYIYYRINYLGEWSYWGASTKTGSMYITNTRWANHDIINPFTSEAYLEASDPVPVYA